MQVLTTNQHTPALFTKEIAAYLWGENRENSF